MQYTTNINQPFPGVASSDDSNSYNSFDEDGLDFVRNGLREQHHLKSCGVNPSFGDEVHKMITNQF